jgi:hypothetical protein
MDVFESLDLTRLKGVYIGRLRSFKLSFHASGDGNIGLWTYSAAALPGNHHRHFIGDGGRGDTPKSRDGVVAYWNPHVDGCEHEEIMP